MSFIAAAFQSACPNLISVCGDIDVVAHFIHTPPPQIRRHPLLDRMDSVSARSVPYEKAIFRRQAVVPVYLHAARC